MRRRSLSIIAMTMALGALVVWCFTGPWSGDAPQFLSSEPVSIDIMVMDRLRGTITNSEALASVIGMLRSGRSQEPCACKHRGIIEVHFANGQSMLSAAV